MIAYTNFQTGSAHIGQRIASTLFDLVKNNFALDSAEEQVGALKNQQKEEGWSLHLRCGVSLLLSSPPSRPSLHPRFEREQDSPRSDSLVGRSQQSPPWVLALAALSPSPQKEG